MVTINEKAPNFDRWIQFHGGGCYDVVVTDKKLVDSIPITFIIMIRPLI